jgi:glycosyltransferase involved in cell wall biosynthesis
VSPSGAPEPDLDVLLFSPVRGVDPPSGDVAYTESLVADPPPGVRYTSYVDAIDDGRVQVRGRRPRHGRFGGADAAILTARAGEVALRRAGVMYREPIWYVTIEPGAFDVVHQHVFAVRQVGHRVPVVSSAGYPLPVLYANRDHWSRRRLQVATALARGSDRMLDVHDPWIRGAQGNVMTVYTEHFRDYLVASGADARDIEVCSTALADVDIPPRRSDGATIGFVGRDFVLKGGPEAVAAFGQLRRERPELRMRLITSRSAVVSAAVGDGMDVVTEATSVEVVRDHLPEIDVLVLPTRSDCGAPYAVLEALRAGIPVVTSTSPWLDERLVPPAVVRGDGRDPSALAAAIERLLEPAHLEAARAAARSLWADQFSTAVLGRQLLAAYRRVATR